MKMKPEEIAMQEMNLLTCRSRLRLIKAELDRLGANHLDLLIELNKLEHWFLDRSLPLPPIYG